MSCGCGSVVRAIDSETRYPWIKPCHWQSFMYQIFYELKYRKGKNKEKRPVTPHLKKEKK